MKDGHGSFELPVGYAVARVIPCGSEASAPIAIAVIAKEAGEKTMPVVTGELPDGVVYLGALMDQGQRLLELVEIWVQRVSGFSDRYPQSELISNVDLDEVWARRCEMYANSDGVGSVILTGAESCHLNPLGTVMRESTGKLDAGEGRADVICEQLRSSEGETLELCIDDVALSEAGLPTYSRSLHRYLWVRGNGNGRGKFYAVTAGAPEPAGGYGSLDLSGAINPEGGLMMVRKHSPLRLNEFVDVISGVPWEGRPYYGGTFHPGGHYRRLKDVKMLRHSGGAVLGHQGVEGQLLEALHLKLGVIGAIIGRVMSETDDLGTPLLNLDTQSFGVRLVGAYAGLPLLWSHEVALLRPAEAFRKLFPGTQNPVSLPLTQRGGGHSIFEAKEFVERSATPSYTDRIGVVRIRELDYGDDESVVIEFTLVADEPLMIGAKDLVRISLRLSAAAPVNIYATRLESGDTKSGGGGGRRQEVIFRSDPMRFSAEQLDLLEERMESGSAPFPNVGYCPIFVAGSTYDLYSIAVIATSVLFRRADLQELVDELLRLAGRLDEVGGQAAGGRGGMIRALVSQDRERLVRLLGPQGLVCDDVSTEQGFAAIPEELWWEVIESVVRLFPGESRVSYAKSFDDYHPRALSRVFLEPSSDFNVLQGKTRGLVFSDWQMNRDVLRALEDVLG